MVAPPSWVMALAECNLDLTFDALRSVVQRDVNEVNQLPAKKRRDYTFKFERNDQGMEPKFLVRRTRENPVDPDNKLDIEVVSFQQTQTFIAVNENGKVLFCAIPQWNADDLSCHLYVDEKPYEAWQVSQKALANLFFGC